MRIRKIVYLGFFVYAHRRVDTGAIFYIGKGTRTNRDNYRRAYSLKGRSDHWHRVVAKAGGYTIDILENFECETEANAREVALIAEHGKMKDGGQLVNFTDGGDGICGYAHTDETRAKIKAWMAEHGHPLKGIPRTEEVKNKIKATKAERMHTYTFSKPMLGREHSAETKARMAARRHSQESKLKMSASRIGMTGSKCKNSRAVIDTKTGNIFPTIDAAAKFVGVARCTVASMLYGVRENIYGLELVDKDRPRVRRKPKDVTLARNCE